MSLSRRNFLKAAGVLASTTLVRSALAQTSTGESNAAAANEPAPDYTIRIAATPIEIAPKKIISLTTYNGQFPGPLLRFKEGRQVTLDLINDTDTPEQLHWHGQIIPVDVDGAAEEGAAYLSPRNPQGIASFTHTTVPAPIFPPASTAARSDTFTSSPSASPATTTASSSWS